MTAPRLVETDADMNWRCCKCQRSPLLITRINGKLYCGECWRKAGSPWPKN